MSVNDMRAYVANMRRGRAGADDLRDLFAGHADRLRREIARLQLRERYVSAKAELWTAKVQRDTAAEAAITPPVVDLIEQLLRDEAQTV
jgi:MerR family transcriptional regulator, aldehyde-responsive regulator